MGEVDDAVAAIRDGRPVILPTDTVYGICASPDRPEPTREVYRLKGRPETMPSALLAGGLEALLECLPELRGHSAAIARALLPGPYTLVLPNPAHRYPWLTGPDPGKIGVRVPALEEPVLEVLARAGPVMATSANRHGGPDPRRLEDVPDEIRAGCGTAVDGGGLPGAASTVIDCTSPEPRVLREGAVSGAEALARVAAVAT